MAKLDKCIFTKTKLLPEIIIMIIITLGGAFYIFKTWNEIQEKRQNEIIVIAKSIEALPGIYKADIVEVFYVHSYDLDLEFQLVNYDTEAMRHLRYPLSEGRYPQANEPNKVILPSFFKNIFEVGDSIDMYFSSFDMQHIDEFKIVNLEVGGFLEEDYYYMNTSLGQSPSFTNFFGAQEDDYGAQGIVFGLIDNNGQEISGNLGMRMIITPEEGVDIEELYKQIFPLVQSKAFLHRGDEMLDNYWRSMDSELQYYSAYGIAFLCLGFSVLLVGTYLSLVSRQKEMAIWTLTGATWKTSIAMVVAPKLLAVLSGYIAGAVSFYLSRGMEIGYGIYAVFSWRYIFISFAVIVMMLLVGVLPFYYSSVKRTPVDNFRKD